MMLKRIETCLGRIVADAAKLEMVLTMDDTNQPVGQWIQKICMGVFTIASLLYLLYAWLPIRRLVEALGSLLKNAVSQGSRSTPRLDLHQRKSVSLTSRRKS